jgi:uncharacterized Fe-S center protein
VSHDVVEIVSSDKSVIVQVCSGEHGLDLLFGQVLTQVLSNSFQLQGCEFSLNINTITDRFRSNAEKTLSTSTLDSLSESLAVANLKNSAKSIPPD